MWLLALVKSLVLLGTSKIAGNWIPAPKYESRGSEPSHVCGMVQPLGTMNTLTWCCSHVFLVTESITQNVS